MSRGPLAYAAYRWLVAARTVSLVGNAVAPIALAFAVLDLTGSVTSLGLVVAARSLANVLLLLFGGVAADRFPRHRLLVGSSVLAALTQAAVAALVISGSATVPVLVVLSALNGAVAALSFPASLALTPQTVPERELQSANALLRLGVNAATIVGASAGGALVATAGPGWGLAVDAGAFAAAAVLFSRIRLTGAAADPSSPRSSITADLREGWGEFVQRRWVCVVVAQFAIVNAAFVGAVTVLGPVVADASFGRAAWGLVLATQTAGLAVGALAALRWRARHALRRGVALTALSALPALALASGAQVALVAGAAFLAGFAIEQFTVAWDVSLQQHVPPDRLARVYSYDAVGSFLAIPIGEAAVGPLAEQLGLQVTLLGCAVAITTATLLALLNTSVRELKVRH